MSAARGTLLVALVMLAGCAREHANDKEDRGGYYDQDVRREVFFECLRAAPAGPQHTKYNDWSEVVGECGDQAHAISARGWSDTHAAPAKVETP
jgi:hypothetical protein